MFSQESDRRRKCVIFACCLLKSKWELWYWYIADAGIIKYCDICFAEMRTHDDSYREFDKYLTDIYLYDQNDVAFSFKPF